MSQDGKKENVSNREYYIEGMKGHSGSCVIFDSHITDETLVVFYAPLYFNDEMIGVLNGIYQEEKMQEIISNTFFGTQAKSYLCMSDGTLITSTGDEEVEANLIENMPGRSSISDEIQSDIIKTFQNHESYGYQYEGSQGIGNAYMTGISHNDWMLIQTFPSGVTTEMIENANSAGRELEISLVVMFGAYIFCLVFWNWRQKRRLLSEKEVMSQIVNGVTQLFTRFVVVDLEKDTYEYLKNTEEDYQEKGTYHELVEYLSPRYVDEDDKKDMHTVITKEHIQEHLKQDTPYLQYEYRIQRGEEKWENISILNLADENEKPTVVLLAIQDVTTLKKEELRNRIALKEAFQAAEEANRAKSDFLSRMSHDIRTPMNAIMGMTTVAAMHLDDKERLIDCMNKITLSSRHLLALINNVLDMSKIESGKTSLSEEEFDLPKMVDSLLAIIYSQINQKGQNLKVNIENITHENIIGDSLRLQQVFVNIMGNAVKFTPEGGTITFSIREKPSRIHGNGFYEFVFEDTGIGMEQEFVERIFEPFSRAESGKEQTTEGTGLGMSIARNIIRMMNGDIFVESRPGVGSKFTVQVYLKLQKEEEEPIDDLSDLRVLVADDDADTCKNTCEILENIGMDPDWVLSGDMAIRKLQEGYENAREYAVVILDWKMPEKDGVETAREIRQKLGDEIPIIILSAYDWSGIEQEAREAGVNAFIAKPLFRSRLVYLLKSLIGEQKRENRVEFEELGQTEYAGKRILLVEDNELNIEIAEELLTYAGIKVTKAYDGQQAVDMVLEKPEYYFDLIFMDIRMPNKNGYEATKEIRSSGREDLTKIPIVAMSADAFSDDIQKAREAGMNDHVAKPVELEKLTEALEKWTK